MMSGYVMSVGMYMIFEKEFTIDETSPWFEYVIEQDKTLLTYLSLDDSL